MIKMIGIIAAALVAALLIFAATQPDTFRVERTTTVHAPPETIFPLINAFHKWNAWSPFEQLDPAMVRTHSGAASGEGAVYEWAGNRKAGSGRMEITNSTPNKNVTVRLDFTKPFEAHNTAEFTLEPRGESTVVTWAMHGTNQYIGKLMCVFVSMDSMIGKDFETGLANLKAVAEGSAVGAT